MKYKVTRFGTLHCACGAAVAAVYLPFWLLAAAAIGCLRCCCDDDAAASSHSFDVRRLAGVLKANPSAAKGEVILGIPGVVRAAELGETQALTLLLNAGAPPDSVVSTQCEQKELVGCSALYFAAQNQRTECVKALLQAGARPDLADPDGKTPLLWAASLGFADVVAALLAAGATPTAGRHMPVKGMNPLEVAVVGDHAACVAKLLDAGAPTTRVLDNGVVFDAATITTSSKVLDMLRAAAAKEAAARQNPLYTGGT